MIKNKIILASSSPRREMLLHKLVSDFDIVIPSDKEIDIGKPDEIAIANAIMKGKSINCNYDVLIACDTLVALDGKIYGKPNNVENACNMLRELSGRTHSVFSGVYVSVKGQEFTFTEISKVTFKSLTNDKIIEYVNKYKPLDKAGSYGIQDKEIVSSYEGEYDNIVGLPTNRLREILREYIDVKD
jgi:septum formation protein